MTTISLCLQLPGQQTSPLLTVVALTICNRTATRLTVVSHGSEGALFALPFGGSTYECTPSGLAKLRSFALQNGRLWYEHFSALARTFSNGHVCLVTGATKAPYWAAAYYRKAPGSPPFSVDIVVPPPNEPDDIFVRNNNYDGPISTRQVVKEDSASRTVHRHCLVYRGFHISLQPFIFNSLPIITYEMGKTPWRRVLPAGFRPPMRSYQVEDHPVCRNTNSYMRLTIRTRIVSVLPSRDHG